ncbi:MAG: fructosamine kinase family protein [Betaproteobacteria bacterium]|nr:fructosamine kinase family protein [Betaproteobacteria bacterium]
MDARLSAAGEAIAAATGRPFAPRDAGAVGGGCIHETVVLSDGAARYFIKLNAAPAPGMFEAEADGLAALAAVGALRVPAVVAVGGNERGAFLVLEHLEMRPLTQRADGTALGRALAALHRDSGEDYGWHRDNFIGATPQANAPHRSWPWFFAHRRLLPQLALAVRNGHGGRWIRDGERLAENTGAFFLDAPPPPSLLHGDLWHGNTAVTADGRPAVFDPAVYRGDRETDLAMAELFGGFPESFYAAYREAWSLPEGFEQRKTLYNLYHVLNHLNLFGAGYLGQAQRMIARLLADLRG